MYIYCKFSFAIGLGKGLFKGGALFINKINEHNYKVDYLLLIVAEELNKRSRAF
jgi:hypothetical protein